MNFVNRVHQDLAIVRKKGILEDLNNGFGGNSFRTTLEKFSECEEISNFLCK